MMYCEKCGQEIPEQVICPKCGCLSGYRDTTPVTYSKSPEQKQRMTIRLLCIIGIVLTVLGNLTDLLKISTGLYWLLDLLAVLGAIAGFVMMMTDKPKLSVVYPVSAVVVRVLNWLYIEALIVGASSSGLAAVVLAAAILYPQPDKKKEWLFYAAAGLLIINMLRLVSSWWLYSGPVLALIWTLPRIAILLFILAHIFRLRSEKQKTVKTE